jgi:GT2 family glycosyltransferase/glycosyltransferase involved in cell wall biosynthesis
MAALPDDDAAVLLSGFFDPDWYADRYPDVIASGWEPLRHYVSNGATEGRDPNRWFDGTWYREHYPDVARSGLPPLLHYLQVGAAEGRNPHPRFDAAWYAAQHPEAAGNPLLYHVRVGAAQGFATEPVVPLAQYQPSTLRPLRCPADVRVDVVIPVYRGLAETRRCLRSVLADRDRPPGRIIVVDDASPEPALSAWLDELAADRRIERMRNRQNLGFVASANRGMTAAGRHDVVLLNSDTEVPRGWLRRLAAQAYAAPDIASVSPLSNNATICSYPGFGGPMPLGLSLAELDAICRRVNAGRSVPVPTTVGFCMYIRRAALDACGLFDAAAFGLGYGEENDFCRRSAARGWQHRLACDTFVYHAGGVSFGDAYDALTQAAGRVLAERWPDYFDLVHRHVVLDQAGPFRFAITAEAFRRSGKPTVLLVSHELGGGVRRHMMSLVERLADQANFLLLSGTIRGAELSVPALRDHPALVLPAERLDDMAALLRDFGVTRVHLHHLMGRDMDVRALIRRLDVPFDTTVHDWYALCPQVNLLPGPELPYCGEPDIGTCNACIACRPSHYALDILSWRLDQSWQFLDADRVFCPSADVQARLVRHGLGARTVVVPHQPVAAGPWPLHPRPLRRGPLRVAVLGVLANHKGAPAVAALAEAADPARLTLHLIGHTEPGFPAEAAARMQITGAYAEADLPRLLAEVRPHVLWYPSPWPETYSFTLSAGIDSGLPIVATAIGAFPERLSGRPLTWLEQPLLATAAWLAVFERVRSELRSPQAVAVPRSAQPDFYPGHYLPPAPGSVVPREPRPPSARGSTRRPALRGGGATRRPRVLLLPERLGNGLLSPCAYIRLVQPFHHLAEREGFDLVLGDLDTALHDRPDVIVTHRYALPSPEAAESLARHARRSGIGLLYDLDDDLLSIPPDHPEAALLRPRTRTVRRMLRLADQVWVSTPALAAGLSHPAISVVPNGLDERLWGTPPAPRPYRFGPARVLYMGTATHDADLALVMPALGRLRQVFHDRVAFDLMGVTRATDLPPWLNRVPMPAMAAASYPGFVAWITDQPAWEVGLAPLADSPFNRGKSAIKTLDYAALGLAVLASDVAPYRGSLADGPGGRLLPADPDAWFEAIASLLREPDRRRAMAAAAVEAYQANGTLAAQAATRQAAWRALRGATPHTASAA